MKKLLAGAVAAGIVSSAGGLGGGVAAADTAYVVGGAKPPGIPWFAITDQIGRGYYPNATRDIVDYPAGTLLGPLPAAFWPDLATPTVGQSIVTGADNLDAAIRSTRGPGVAVGLSEGTLVLDAEQERLAHDPTAPPRDQLSFTVFVDPSRSFLHLFSPGTYIPIVDYTVPQPVESQYDTTVVAAQYDCFSDFPDRPWNLVSLANSLVGGATVHTAAAFTSLADVPPENITTTTNSRGATTTTYLVPFKQLPLTLPLRTLGVPDEVVDQIDDALRPMVDAGYSRNDGRPSSATGVDLQAALNKVPGLLPGGTLNQVPNLFGSQG